MLFLFQHLTQLIVLQIYSINFHLFFFLLNKLLKLKLLKKFHYISRLTFFISETEPAINISFPQLISRDPDEKIIFEFLSVKPFSDAAIAVAQAAVPHAFV